MMPRSLYLGCGDEDTRDGIGVDIIPGPSVKVVADLSRPPLPFSDDKFDVVHCNNILEHIDDVLGTMADLHRVCRNGARIHINIVHFTHVNMYDDPTHKRSFSYHTFHLLTVPEYELRRKHPWAEFRLVKRYLHFRQPYRCLGVACLANRFPYVYERYFCWMAPAWLIEAELEVVKQQ